MQTKIYRIDRSCTDNVRYGAAFVSKKTENGKYLKGATLKITAEKDTSFEAITIKTDGKPAYFDSSRFTAGTTYVVSETKAPKGYSYATDVKFKLDQDGNVYVNGKKSKDKSIIMTDEKIRSRWQRRTKILISIWKMQSLQ